MLKKSCCDFCFPQESKPQTDHCSIIYMTRQSVRIGFNVIKKCHILPVVYAILVKIC